MQRRRADAEELLLSTPSGKEIQALLPTSVEQLSKLRTAIGLLERDAIAQERASRGYKRRCDAAPLFQRAHGRWYVKVPTLPLRFRVHVTRTALDPDRCVSNSQGAKGEAGGLRTLGHEQEQVGCLYQPWPRPHAHLSLRQISRGPQFGLHTNNRSSVWRWARCALRE